MPLGKGNQTTDTQTDFNSRGRLPVHGPGQKTVSHIQRPVVGQDRSMGQGEGLSIDEQLDPRPVGYIEHGLRLPGVTVGILCVGNRSGFEEPIQIGSPLKSAHTLFKGPAYTYIVPDRKADL